jgi:hypothetical protein
MVMFTDGQSTAGGSAVPITTLAKENGVVMVVMKVSKMLKKYHYYNG